MTLGTLLPAWPALLFGYLEPAVVLKAWYDATTIPHTFTLAQDPTPRSSTTPLNPATAVVSYSLGNLYLVLALFAVLVVHINRDPRVTKFYLFFLAIGDLGHLVSFYRALGEDVFWDWSRWNEMVWGNIVATMFLFVNRLSTLAGVFGRVGGRR
ncbi:hypothetical protein GQ43DRAFT_436845 [Delitschia confertaspora ATCC 74209]|uniref:DUF7704 domain-containing protein n=1 Tax=Delitschia confertaspora ATCC 74209 TaxID=1513339 RepID=A0A9P4JWF5_9PLEO|nr:hypothetical protein GQ43DRAFT_436845 [Delitschia confertaspora ATCC 74209]